MGSQNQTIITASTREASRAAEHPRSALRNFLPQLRWRNGAVKSGGEALAHDDYC